MWSCDINGSDGNREVEKEGPMIWLGVLCLLLAVALAGYVAATERQMRVLADALAVRGRDLRRVRRRAAPPSSA